MTAETISRALGGRCAEGGGYMAPCPAHDDRNPSLSIFARDGKLLVKCFAGCEQAAVIDALRARGLWPEGRDSFKQRIAATYDYTDAEGELLYQVVRLVPKDFRQRRPDGRGGWVWRTKGVSRVLYRLREVLEAPIVFYVEGEKDVETLREWGFCATTAAGGAEAKWEAQFTEALKGREVIIIPDNDKPGWERATYVSRRLVGNVARLRIFDLPPTCKDITDYFERGHSECELIATLEDAHAV